MKLPEDKYGISFLLSQFQSLMSHIDTLISSSTMRIYSLLLIWAFTISSISILIYSTDVFLKIMTILIIVGIFLLIPGIYIFIRQISSSKKIVLYYRIINRIRKVFNEKSPEIENIITLPVSDEFPKSISQVFDPGIPLIALLNGIAICLVIYGIFHSIFWAIFSLSIAIIIQISVIKLIKI